MNVLITGCNGLLGQKLRETAPDSVSLFGIDLHPVLIGKDNCDYRTLDLTDRQVIRDTVETIRPEWILNAAAYTQVDKAEEERDLCWQANLIGVENLIYAARKVNGRIVHISTDYIFDGTSGPYDEEAMPNPLGFYGRSKLASENALKLSPLGYAIVRTMVLYGQALQVKPNFVTWLIDQLQKGNPVRIVTDQYGNTTLADELANAIWEIVQQEAVGLFHIASRDVVDRFTFSRMIADVFDLDAQLISPITTPELNQKAPRPLQSGLIVSKAMETLGLELSDSRQALELFKTQRTKM